MQSMSWISTKYASTDLTSIDCYLFYSLVLLPPRKTPLNNLYETMHTPFCAAPSLAIERQPPSSPSNWNLCGGKMTPVFTIDFLADFSSSSRKVPYYSLLFILWEVGDVFNTLLPMLWCIDFQLKHSRHIWAQLSWVIHHNRVFGWRGRYA